MPENNRLLVEAKCYYDLDHYLFDQVTKRFEQEHTLSAFDFFAIITWKANRAKTKVQAGLRTANLIATRLMKRVRSIHDDSEKMQALDNVPGIGIPIASAILTVCYPTRFTVLDYRAWETLHELNYVSYQTMPDSIKGYFERYLPVCKHLAEQMKITLRDLDLALWGWSQRKSIEEVATT